MYYYNKGISNSYLGHNEEAYNDFIKGYDLAGYISKNEYKQRIVKLAKQNNKAAIEICDEMDWGINF